MPTPTQRRNPSHRKQRAWQLRLKSRTVARCEQCGKARKSHRACAFCGTYKK